MCSNMRFRRATSRRRHILASKSRVCTGDMKKRISFVYTYGGSNIGTTLRTPCTSQWLSRRSPHGPREEDIEKKKEKNGDREWLEVGRGWHWRKFGYKKHRRRRRWHERQRQRIKVRTILSRSISLLTSFSQTNMAGTVREAEEIRALEFYF